MTLTQLRYILAIAKTGSINKAAEILYVSQPSLTNAVKEVEKEIGIVIFYRSGKGVTLTNDGKEFVLYARQVCEQQDKLLEKYGKGGNHKKKFAVSTQHYSFAVHAFVEMVKNFDATAYEFAIRETRTREVISDVSQMKSEIGVLYLSSFNRKALEKVIRTAGLEFKHLVSCRPYVYLWKGHPLAGEKEIAFEQLKEYPCLSFEQGDNGSFYFAEEILPTAEYPCIIKANDRATMLNLMVGLNGYTLCSGIICEELNGSDYLAVPFKEEDAGGEGTMEIGCLTRKDMRLSSMGELYIQELDRYLHEHAD